MSDPKHNALATAAHGELAERVHPLVEVGMRALVANPNPDTLRELLSIQREYEAGEARKAYARALVALKRDLPTVLARDKKVDFQSNKGPVRYTHTSLAAVMDAITEPLTAHGFSLAWTPSTTDRAVSVTCRLTHSGGHCEEATLSAPPDAGGTKSSAQAIASSITLLQRYTALSLLGIATADMVDPTPAERSAADGPHIDAARNLRAVGKLARHGRSREEAEAFLGRPVAAWTTSDLERLAAWVKPSHDAGAGEVPADQEPPEPGANG